MEYEDETFALIKEYPNYAVSNYARVLNKLTQNFLKPCVGTEGYLYISLCGNGKLKKHKIHLLVAKAFIKNNKDDKIYIDHIDRNRINNSLSNLRWVSINENNCNMSKRITFATSKYMGVCFAKKEKKWISQIALNKKNIRIGGFNTENEAAEARNNYVINHKLTDLFPLNIIQ